MGQQHKKLLLFILLLIVFINFMGIGLVYPLFSSMLFHRDIALLPPETTNAARGMWLGILLAAMPLCQFLSAPIIGTFSDQKGRKSLLKNTLVIGVIGYFVAAVAVWSESLGLLLFSRMIVGISAGSAAVVAAAAADISPPEEKAKHFGLLDLLRN